ncbi:MAG: FecR family protein [Bacteroidales bacterium]|nr:FecR family protein [Bacteroidales bacterium]
MNKKRINIALNNLINYDNKSNDIMQNMKKDELEEFNDYKKIWQKAAELDNPKIPKIDIEGDWNKVKNRISFQPSPKKLQPHKYFMRIAAIFIAAVGLSVGLIQMMKVFTSNDGFITVASNDSVKEYFLPDGSKLVLNQNSEIIYNGNFNVNKRDIILTGEAYFEVKSNENLPFRVYTGNSTVEVLGTAFNIRQEEHKTFVNVTHGKVMLSETDNDSLNIKLTKDEEAVYDEQNHTIELTARTDVNDFVWRTGKFVFKGTPISKVMQSIADFYDLNITPNNKFDSITIRGTFDNHSLDEILAIINSTIENHIKMAVIDNELTLIHENQN